VHNRFEIRDLTKLFQRSLSASRQQAPRRAGSPSPCIHLLPVTGVPDGTRIPTAGTTRAPELSWSVARAPLYSNRIFSELPPFN